MLHLAAVDLRPGCCAGVWPGAQKPAVKQLHVPVPMRDGVRLSANVFLPSEHARVPAILVRTPYGKGAGLTPNYQAFVDHGYAVMVEDVRGRYESEGIVPAAETGAGRRRRHLELDRAPALVGRQDRHDRRFVPGDRAVEGGAARQSAPESHLPGGFGVRRLSRPVLLDGRRHEAGEPAGVDVREPEGAGLSAGFQQVCAAPVQSPPRLRRASRTRRMRPSSE